MGQCVGCVKYILFIFNFSLWLLGCALLSVGIWLKTDSKADQYIHHMTEVEVDEEYQITYSATDGNDLSVTLSYLLIVFGIILIIVTFIGCAGAVRENICLLGVFAICLFILMGALISVGGWAFYKKNKLKDEKIEGLTNKTDANLEKGVETYQSNPHSKHFMDSIQKRFRCCGSHRARDDYLIRGNVIPATCEPKESHRSCNYYYWYYADLEIKEFLKKRYTIIAGVSIGVALCLGLGTAFTILLCCLIRRATRLVVS